jgi:hypothetical protein
VKVDRRIPKSSEGLPPSPQGKFLPGLQLPRSKHLHQLACSCQDYRVHTPLSLLPSVTSAALEADCGNIYDAKHTILVLFTDGILIPRPAVSAKIEYLIVL